MRKIWPFDAETAFDAIAYIYVAVWALGTLFFTPVSFTAALTRVGIEVWSLLALGGAVVALIGLAQHKRLTLEFYAAIILLTGPVGYFLTEFALTINDVRVTGATQRVPLTIGTLAGVLLLARIIVFLGRKRGLAKRTPLESELDENAA